MNRIGEFFSAMYTSFKKNIIAPLQQAISSIALSIFKKKEAPQPPPETLSGRVSNFLDETVHSKVHKDTIPAEHVKKVVHDYLKDGSIRSDNKFEEEIVNIDRDAIDAQHETELPKPSFEHETIRAPSMSLPEPSVESARDDIAPAVSNDVSEAHTQGTKVGDESVLNEISATSKQIKDDTTEALRDRPKVGGARRPPTRGVKRQGLSDDRAGDKVQDEAPPATIGKVGGNIGTLQGKMKIPMGPPGGARPTLRPKKEPDNIGQSDQK